MPGRRRDLIVALAVAAALAVVLALPAAGSAGLVDKAAQRLAATVKSVVANTAEPADRAGGADDTGGSATKAGAPPDYTPPLHGTNPHGQGTIGVVDVTPEDTEPLPYDPDGGSEDVVVGSARGEQVGDNYHGHITIAALLGNEILGVDTNENEAEAGPLEPLQEAVLDAVCTGSGDTICLEVLAADSSTTSTGSENHFSVLSADAGVDNTALSLSAGVAESNGNIEENGDCQTATGSSQVADADVGGGLVTANLLRSISTSSACNDGTTTQDNTSSGINVLGTGLPLPQPGCEAGTPNTVFNPAVIGLLLSAVCNADDSNGAQAALPYGVREALSVFVLALGGPDPLIKVTTAGGESHAVAPGCPDGQILVDGECVCPPGEVLVDGECVPDREPPEREREPEGGAGEAGGPGGPDDELPFTGTSLVTLLLIGLSVMGAGLGAMAYADERRRRRLT